MGVVFFLSFCPLQREQAWASFLSFPFLGALQRTKTPCLLTHNFVPDLALMCL